MKNPLRRPAPARQIAPPRRPFGAGRFDRHPVHLETFSHPEEGFLLLGVIADPDGGAHRFEALHGSTPAVGEAEPLGRASDWLLLRREAALARGFAPARAHPDRLWDAVLRGAGVGPWARETDLRDRPEPARALAEPDEALEAILRSDAPIELATFASRSSLRYGLEWWRHRPGEEWERLRPVGERVARGGLIGLRPTPELRDHPIDVWLLVAEADGRNFAIEVAGPEIDVLPWSERRMIGHELCAIFGRANFALALPEALGAGTTRRWRASWLAGGRGLLGCALAHALAADARVRPWLLDEA